MSDNNHNSENGATLELAPLPPPLPPPPLDEQLPLPPPPPLQRRLEVEEEEIVFHDMNSNIKTASWNYVQHNDHHHDDDDENGLVPNYDISLNKYNSPTTTTTTTTVFTILAGTLWLFLPTVLYLALFTKMGIGFNTYATLMNAFASSSSSTTTTHLLGPEVLALTLVLYWCDVVYWKSCGWKVYWGFVWLLLATAYSLTVLHTWPFAPLALLLAVWIPLWMILLFRLLSSTSTSQQQNNSRVVVAKTRVYPFMIVAVITFLSWFIWTFLSDDNEFNSTVASLEASSAVCIPTIDLNQYPECQAHNENGSICFADANDYNTNDNGCPEYCLELLYQHCYTPFFIWSGPLLLSLGLLALGCWIHVLFRKTKTTTTPDSDNTTTAAATKSSSSSNNNKKKKNNIWIPFWSFVLFGLWVSASLWGVGTGVSTTLLVLTMSCLVAIVLLVWLLPTRTTTGNHPANNSIMNRLGLLSSSSASDETNKTLYESYITTSTAMRGLLVLTCLPLVVVYLALQLVRQMVRRETKGWFVPDTIGVDIYTSTCWTMEGLTVIQELQSWQPRTAIFMSAMYWSLAFFLIYVVGAQFTIVLLSYLLQTLTADSNNWSLTTITLILCSIGLGMFLLPPVPGVPIYMTLGMILIPVGQSECGWAPWQCILYGLCVSLALKLIACTVQQKVIGGGLQHCIAIRQYCRVNSDMMRSMKLVLTTTSSGGWFSWNKVFILVGGPDWPTSVLCGIMGLPLLPILMGTLPIIVLITPTLLTGSFTYLASVQVWDGQGQNEPLYPQAQTWATICAAVTAVVQLGSMVLAASAVSSNISSADDEKKSRLDELVPLDPQVLEADLRAQVRQDLYDQVTDWHQSMSWMMKIVTMVALTAWIVSFHLLMYFDNYCFVEYQLSYTIESHLQGSVWNFILPLGWIAMGLALLGGVLQFIVFGGWARSAVKKKQGQQQQQREDTLVVDEDGGEKMMMGTSDYESYQPPPGVQNPTADMVVGTTTPIVTSDYQELSPMTLDHIR